MELKDVEKQLGAIETELKKWIDKHADEVKVTGTASTETKAALEKLGTQHTEVAARLLTIEQKLTAPNAGGGNETKSMGEIVTESDQFKNLQAGANSSGKIKIGSTYNLKANLINATGLNQPLVPAFARPGIFPPGLRRLTVRDLLPNTQISTNLVTYVKETSFTNSAAMQTSEGTAKAESALAFALSYSPVQTLAHFLPVSRQLLDDAPAIQGYVNSRLMYGLKLVEEAQFLSGNGVGTNLRG
jgi:HK97 family phage major capsid protein